MKATLVFRSKDTVTVRGGKQIVVAMDLFKLPPGETGYPDGYKFSWIAFDPDEPSSRVLFDVHPPKGPHIHIDGDPVGTSYEWNGLSQAREFFLSKVKDRFGDFVEEHE